MRNEVDTVNKTAGGGNQLPANVTATDKIVGTRSIFPTPTRHQLESASGRQILLFGGPAEQSLLANQGLRN